jgi:hypothetical protein
MSSASKGRYQSRLFNFFHKQSRRFGEGFGRSLRQLQVATGWSLEALSKSIYLLLQKAADSTGTQLPGTAAEPQLHLQPSEPISDTAIVRILENVETRYIPSAISQTEKHLSEQDAEITINRSNKQKIQGVASQLSSQSLVLVTNENEILDILTPSQQQALENQIISEIASYWHSWRLFQENQEKLPYRLNIFKRLASGSADEKKTLPGENTTESDRKYLQINPATLASLDTAVANLETNALAPVSRAQIIVRQRGGELIQVVKTRLDVFLYGDSQVTLSQQDIVADGNLETHPSKIQALIEAAFNYFYSKSKDKEIKQAPAKPLLSSTQSKSPQIQSEQSEDNWLSSADLFGNGFPQLNPTNRASNKLAASKQQLNPATKNQKSSQIFGRFQMPNWRTLRLKERAGLQQSQKGILKNQQDGYIKPSEQDAYVKPSEQDAYVKPSEQDAYVKPSEQDARTTLATSGKIPINSAAELQSRSKRKIAQGSESTEIEAKPEWIETKAEIVGYQKHPLEQLLAWIDNTMLKIEEAIAKFASALQQIWRK